MQEQHPVITPEMLLKQNLDNLRDVSHKARRNIGNCISILDYNKHRNQLIPEGVALLDYLGENYATIDNFVRFITSDNPYTDEQIRNKLIEFNSYINNDFFSQFNTLSNRFLPKNNDEYLRSYIRNVTTHIEGITYYINKIISAN